MTTLLAHSSQGDPIAQRRGSGARQRRQLSGSRLACRNNYLLFKLTPFSSLFPASPGSCTHSKVFDIFAGRLDLLIRKKER